MKQTLIKITALVLFLFLGVLGALEDVRAGSPKIEPILLVSLDADAVRKAKQSGLKPKPILDESISLSGYVQGRVSKDTQGDPGHENETSFRNRVLVKADYGSLTVSGLSDYLYFGSRDITEEYDMELHELYVRHRTGALEMSVGKQIRRWGKADQISPIDTLNPENSMEFIVPPYEERKIPIWMADLTFRKNDFFVEGVFIPFFEPSRFHYMDTDWAVFSHLKKDIQSAPLPDGLKSYFDEALGVRETEPDSGTDSFEYALRVGGTLGRVDFGFTYHYANEDLPYFKNFPVKNLALNDADDIQAALSDPAGLVLADETIETEYRRTHIAGFEFETVARAFGLRGEAVFKENESFLTGDLTSVRRPSSFWVVGLDYLGVNQWYMNLQLAHQHIFDYDPSILYLDSDNYSIIGEIRKDLGADWLTAGLQFTQMLNDGSYYLSPRLSYTYIRNLDVMLGLNIFGGDPDTIMGRYDENDQLFLNMKYHF